LRAGKNVFVPSNCSIAEMEATTFYPELPTTIANRPDEAASFRGRHGRSDAAWPSTAAKFWAASRVPTPERAHRAARGAPPRRGSPAKDCMGRLGHHRPK